MKKDCAAVSFGPLTKLFKKFGTAPCISFILVKDTVPQNTFSLKSGSIGCIDL